MSHVARVDLSIESIDCLTAACAALGLAFLEGQRTFAWFGRWVKDYHQDDAAYRHGIAPEDYGRCEHAIGVPGSRYEIGVCRDAAGKLRLVYDFYGPGAMIAQRLGGTALPLLKEEYGAQVAMQVAARKGWKVQRTKHPQTGRTRLVCHR